MHQKKEKENRPKNAASKQKSQNNHVKGFVIASVAVAVVVISVFLIIYFTGRIPPKLEGTWYEPNGYGTFEFNTDGVVKFSASGYDSEGKYTFNGAANQGKITLREETTDFTCDGSTLTWEGAVYTKNYVPQVEFNFNNMIGDIENQLK